MVITTQKVLFDSFLITKAIWDWGELFGIHGKAMEISETWRTKALKSFSISKSGMQGGEVKRNLPWSIFYDSHVSHFWSTSWSPIYVCYMSFQSLGSQKANASNGVQFGAEMKELHPLEAEYCKLKANFAALRSYFAALFVRLRNLTDLVFTYEMVLSASRYLWPTLWDIFLQIFVV